MKPTAIFEILDLTVRARNQGRVFNPCFISSPGLGKSEIVQQWCRQNNYPFIDIRTALLEAPDLIGYPTIVNKNGKQRTEHATPDFFPTDPDSKGVIFWDELNRGNTSVMNALMQALTDRKIKDYEFPEGWIQVAAINPENADFDVNTMDAALKDRLEFFSIEYDKKVFVNFMEKSDWDPTLRVFIESNTWQYRSPDEIGNVAGSKYLSPRSFSKFNTAIKAGLPQPKQGDTENMELMIYTSMLGELTGKAFYQFKHNDQPVTFEDLSRDLKKSLKQLSKFTDPKNYKTGHVSITIRSMIENQKDVTNELLYKVCMTMGPEQSVNMIREMEFKRGGDILLSLTKEFPKLLDYFQEVLAKEKKK